jgi:putative MATE family efflux protein
VSIKESDAKFDRMTTRPVQKLVCEMAAPSIVIMLVTTIYNATDTWFVSSIGTSATAAIGVSFSFMAIIQAIGFLFGHGAGNFISRALGARQQDVAARMASTGFFTSFILGIVIAAIGIIFLTPLAKLLGSTETILPFALEYLLFILIGAPFAIASFMLNNLLRFQGSAFFGMIGMVSGAFLNIALAPLFIFVLGMGVSGAGLATMISQIASCALLFRGCMRGGNIRISFRDFSPDAIIYKEMLRGGTPSLLRQSMIALGALFMNHAAAGYGDEIIAAITIVNRITMLSISGVLGLGQGFQPVCGFNYGAKRYDRVKKAFRFCVTLSTAALTMLAILCFIFAPDVIALFRKDDFVVIQTGAFMLRAQCLSFPVLSLSFMLSMMLQTIGRTLPANILAFARQGLFLIPLLFILVPLFGVRGIQICAPIADFCVFLLAIPLGVSVMRKLAHDTKDRMYR